MSSDSIVVTFRARLAAAADRPLRANAPSAIALGGIACLIGFVLVGPLVSRGAADDAGVLSFLLGEGRRAPDARQTNAYARPRYDMAASFGRGEMATTPARPARANVRQAYRAKVASHAHKLRSIVVVTPPKRPTFVAKAAPTLMTDETLRRGDAVMTAKGVRIFMGSHHYPYDVADFRPLAFAGKVTHRTTLLAIDRVVRPPTWSTSFTKTAPMAFAEPRSISDGAAVRVVETERRS